MPTVTETTISAWVSCRDGRCPGYKQQSAQAVKTVTAFSYFDLGGDVPGIEREAEVLWFADIADEPCPYCDQPRLIADQVRPIYPNVSGVPQDALLQVGRDSERIAQMQQRRHPDATAVELIAVIDRLCQRVQAPAAAILEHDEAVRSPRSEEYAPPAVAPEDDEGYWESRDKLAELMMAEELSGRS
jgi:hypothetical protein